MTVSALGRLIAGSRCNHAFGGLVLGAAMLLLAAVATAGGSTSTGTHSNPTTTTPKPATRDPAQQKITLTPSSTSRTVPFGLDRGIKTITINYTADKALAQNAALDVVLGDLSGSHDVFPASQITTAKTLLSGGLVLKVTAIFDPKDVKSGSYTGKLQVVGTNVAAADVSLKAILNEHSGAGYLLAFLVILLGVLVGGLMKWLSDTGAKLGTLRARLTDLDIDLAAERAETIPLDYRAQMARARRLIMRGDATDAEPLVTSLIGKEDAIISLARRLGMLEDDIVEQRRLIKVMTVDAQTRERLRDVILVESAWPQEIATASWPDPTSTQSNQQEKTRWVDAFTRFLRRYAAATPQDRGKPPLSLALDQFHDGDFDKAIASLASTTPTRDEQSELTALVARDAVSEEAAEPPAPPAEAGGGVMAKVRRFLSDNAGILISLLFGLLVALVGLKELYGDRPGAGDSIIDWVQFFAWGFAIQVSGITAAQAALRLAPSR
jgi:hypothetical protein